MTRPLAARATRATVASMETVSHRDLRNRSGAVLRAVGAGESFTVTNDGRPVARLVPIEQTAGDLPLARPARVQGGFGALPRVVIDGTVRETLDELRGDR